MTAVRGGFKVTKDQNNQIISCSYGQAYAYPESIGVGAFAQAFRLTSASGGYIVVKSTYRKCFFESKEEAAQNFEQELKIRHKLISIDAKREAYFNQRQDNGVGAYEIGPFDFRQWTWDANEKYAFAWLNIEILSQFKSGVTFFEFIKTLGPTKKADYYALFIATLHAVESLPFVHCDLHGANLLVYKEAEQLHVYPIDNGFAVEEDEKKDENIKIYRHIFSADGLKRYPPEITTPNRFARKPTKASDMWMLGELFKNYSVGISLGLEALFKRMMDSDPAKRPSFKEARDVIEQEKNKAMDNPVELTKATEHPTELKTTKSIELTRATEHHPTELKTNKASEHSAQSTTDTSEELPIELSAKADALEKKIDKENFYEWIYYRVILELDSENVYEDYSNKMKFLKAYGDGYYPDYQYSLIGLLGNFKDLRRFFIEIFSNLVKQIKNMGTDSQAADKWCAAQYAVHYFKTCESITIKDDIEKCFNALGCGVRSLIAVLKQADGNDQAHANVGKKLFVEMLPYKGHHFLQNFKEIIPKIFSQIQDAKFKLDLLRYIISEYKRALALCLSFGVFSDSVKSQIAVINQLLKGESVSAEDAHKSGLTEMHEQLQRCEVELGSSQAGRGLVLN